MSSSSLALMLVSSSATLALKRALSDLGMGALSWAYSALARLPRCATVVRSPTGPTSGATGASGATTPAGSALPCKTLPILGRFLAINQLLPRLLVLVQVRRDGPEGLLVTRQRTDAGLQEGKALKRFGSLPGENSSPIPLREQDGHIQCSTGRFCIP